MFQKLKKKNVNLNIIIFQIYLHLSLICDLEIIILNKEHYDEQIQFALQIDAFKNHNKKEPYIISHDANSYIENDYSYFEAESIFHYDSDDDDSSSDEYKKEYSDDQDNDINDEFNSFDKHNAVDSNIIYRNTKRFYFVKGPSYENDTETFNIFFSTDKFILELHSLDKSSEFYYKNVSNLKTYNFFCYILKKYNQKITYDISDIETNFKMIDHFSLNPIYINMKTHHKDEMNDIILKRYEMLKSIYESNHDQNFISTIFEKEITHIFASYDQKFLQKCMSLITYIKTDSKSRDTIISELKIK